jgi:hypothetical protein
MKACKPHHGLEARRRHACVCTLLDLMCSIVSESVESAGVFVYQALAVQ